VTNAFGGLSEKEGYSVALRLLIHYVADVHQPLHVMTRVNNEYPSGDHSGQDFKIPVSDNARTLHEAFDAAMYKNRDKDLEGPFSRGEWKNLLFESSAIQTIYPEESLGKGPMNLNFDDWLKETEEKVKSSVYKGVSHKENIDLTEEYIAEQSGLIEKQLVLGGLRLAYLLESYYGTAPAIN
jgi:hypothetical protein